MDGCGRQRICCSGKVLFSRILHPVLSIVFSGQLIYYYLILRVSPAAFDEMQYVLVVCLATVLSYIGLVPSLCFL